MPAITAATPAHGPVFAAHAENLHSLGLCPIPCGGDDGKVPLIATANWRRRPGSGRIAQLARRSDFAVANIGILTGLSNITIVDCDDAKLLPFLEQTCGPTPLVTRTPSGGYHLWYRANGERCANLRDRGLAVDIKGKGGFVVVPPSRRWSGKHAGIPYVFHRGNWEDLPQLPPIRRRSLMALTGGYSAPAAPTAIPNGFRNGSVFKAGLRMAPHASDASDLAAILADVNEAQCQPSLDRSEVDKTAASAWRYQAEGRNWVGIGAFILMNGNLRRVPGPNAFWLLAHLRRAHAARGGSFKICARAMAEARSAPELGERAIRQATRDLVEAGFLIRIYEGGRGPRDASEYVFGHDPAVLVTD